ncbi:MAG: hypothetical protein EP344_03035 [Bacteroidetes bacterium]|nr:MAG: hypothetical protein EP344_03035 [Bacteroidota bacterium]
MKHRILFSCILLLLPCFFLFAQQTSSWQKLEGTGLAGPAFKLPTRYSRPFLMVGVNASKYWNSAIPNGLFSTQQFAQLEQSFYTNTVLWNNLFQNMNGEVWLGTPSGPGSFESIQTQPLWGWGADLVIPLWKRWAVHSQFSNGSFATRASFPVTVSSFIDIIDITNPDPVFEVQVFEGTAEATIKQTLASLAVRYYPTDNPIFQPFFGVGGVLIQKKASAPLARFIDQEWTISPGNGTVQMQDLAALKLIGIKPYLQAGLSSQIGLLNLEVSGAKLDEAYSLTLAVKICIKR